MDKIKMIKEAIENAIQRKSNLTEGVIDSVGGFISPNNRHLYNNLGAISSHYFEVGSHLGSSLISTVYGNTNLKTAVACDNFSQFENDGKTKAEFFKNADKHIPNQYSLLEKDCFKIAKTDLPNPVDLYLFDGSHNFESQRDAVTYFKEFMADEFIFVVDDGHWQDVIKGTRDGILSAGLKIEYEQSLFSGQESDCGTHGWWNGLLIFLLKK